MIAIFAVLALAAVDVPPEPAHLAPAPSAPAAAAVAAAGAVGDAAAVDPLAALGPVTARAQRGSTLYLALAGGGVAVVDVSDGAAPRVVAKILEGRAVSRLLVDGDKLWAIVLSEEAVALSLADPLAPVATLPGVALPAATTEVASVAVEPTPTVPGKPAKPAAAALARGKVVAVTEGRAIFDGGKDAGFTKGMRVKVISQRPVRKPNLAGDGFAEIPSGEVTAVVAVEEIDGGRAMVVLGRGDVAEPGDLVESTSDDLSESLWLPRRAPFTLRAGFHARPFLGLNVPGSFPVGALVDVYGVYTFADLPLSLGAEISPAGFVIGSADLHYPITVAATAAYVTDYFEVGLGAGALFGNKGPCSSVVLVDGVPTDASVCEVNNGVTVNQILRLGSVDGLSFLWRSSIFARPDGFTLGVGRGEVGVPVSSRLGLFGGGGVGENGWAFGELGVRSFFGGTGGPGTLILQASLGGAGIFDGPGQNVGGGFFQRETVAGPSVAVGMEWRI